MNVLILTSFSIVTTLLGGLFAFYAKRYYHLLLGFTGGAVLAVVSFDIMPEFFERGISLSISPNILMLSFVFGFLLFHIVEKFILIHYAHEEEYVHHTHPALGVGSALVLIGHSFLDGIGVGLAFQVSNTAGFAVLLAVLAHDFADGVNTVSFMLSHKNTRGKTMFFLVLDSIAPVVGAASTLFFAVSQQFSVFALGLFAGFLMYICASEILPEAHSEKTRWTTVLFTILGVVVMYYVLSSPGI